MTVMRSTNFNYQLIYADPPWHFRVRSEKGEGRSAKKHYPVMSLDEIAGLPISKIAAKNSVLLMWAIDPMLDVAFGVIKAWGFKFKTVGFILILYENKSLVFSNNSTLFFDFEKGFLPLLSAFNCPFMGPNTR